MSAPPAPPPIDRLLAGAALAVAVIAGIAAWRSARAGDQLPDDETWRRVAAAVRAQVRPGDLITFAPPWIEPIGRMHLGALISLADAGRADAARYSRVWVISVRGATSPEVAGEVAAVTSRDRGLTAQRFDRQAAEVLDDVFAALPRAKIEGELTRGPEVVLAEVGFSPRRCVQVVPEAGGAVRVTLPAFALGRTLKLWAGLADVFTRRDVREPGAIELSVGGRVVGALVVGVEDGWRALTVETRPGPTEVVVAVRAPSPRAVNRQICFALESRR